MALSPSSHLAILCSHETLLLSYTKVPFARQRKWEITYTYPILLALRRNERQRGLSLVQSNSTTFESYQKTDRKYCRCLSAPKIFFWVVALRSSVQPKFTLSTTPIQFWQLLENGWKVLKCLSASKIFSWVFELWSNVQQKLNLPTTQKSKQKATKSVGNVWENSIQK